MMVHLLSVVVAVVRSLFLSVFVAGVCTVTLLQGAPVWAADGAVLSARWTGKEDLNADFSHIVETLNQKTGAQIGTSDFVLFEDTTLATSHFRTYLQLAGQLPINGRSIRVWTDRENGSVIQVEAFLEGKQAVLRLQSKLNRYALNSANQSPQVLQRRLMARVRTLVSEHRDDPNFRSVRQRDEWYADQPVRVFEVQGRHGKHVIRLSLESGQVVTNSYVEFPQADSVAHAHRSGGDEFSVPALVYPIYEEAGGVTQTRILAQLKHLKRQIARVSVDPFASLRLRRYFADQQDPVLGATAEGQALGRWSMPDIKRRAAFVRESLPLTENSFAKGLVLEGRYASVSLHPDASKFQGIAFKPQASAQFKPSWVEVAEGDRLRDEMIPGAALLGRPLMSFEDAFSRPARRLPSNDPVTYLNDGFDEIQVYYAIDTLMDTFHAMGFTDPELSERPFNAFLFDPDVSMRNNAFYTDDTIHFTTYSPGFMNYARDNSTIWHELGHGMMDRLMGDLIVLNDSGGLSEGMADFLASLVIAKVTNGLPFPGQDDFRIVNKTAFFLTNESHDDGEAYGGAMYDFLNAARAKFGEQGTVKVADLTLEAMRLTRNHPALTAPDWFGHMLFADELGHGSGRAPGELKGLIQASLAGRNFANDPSKAASFDLKFNGHDVGPADEGSRAKPIKVILAPEQSGKFTLNVQAKESAEFPLHYPVSVVVGFRGAPIQGAIHWLGEENGDQTYVLNSAEDTVAIDLAISGVCDEVNRPDGSCVDYAYVQLKPKDSSKPVGKKRFYLRLTPQKP